MQLFVLFFSPALLLFELQLLMTPVDNYLMIYYCVAAHSLDCWRSACVDDSVRGHCIGRSAAINRVCSTIAITVLHVV